MKTPFTVTEQLDFQEIQLLLTALASIGHMTKAELEVHDRLFARLRVDRQLIDEELFQASLAEEVAP